MNNAADLDLRPASTLVRGDGRADHAFCPLSAFAAPGLQDVASPAAAHMALASHGLSVSPLVLVQEAGASREQGAIHARGLARLGIDPARVIRVRAARPRDALWAMEEAVKAGIGVIGEIAGAPRVLDFTATRRLSLFAEAGGVRCVLVRIGAGASTAGPSGAPWRWCVTPSPSLPDPHDARAPGRARWSLELLRARTRPPGQWLVEAESEPVGDERFGAAHRLRVVPPLADGDLETGEEAAGGVVLPFRPRRAA